MREKRYKGSELGIFGKWREIIEQRLPQDHELYCSNVAMMHNAKPSRASKLKGLVRQGFAFTFVTAAYDLVRLPRLIASAA